MPGATPIYGLPYPIGTDRLDAAVTTIPQALATAVESTIAGFGGIAAPGAWTALPYAAGWADLGGAYQPGQYRKVGQAVYIRGVINRTGGASGASGVLCTLPVGFRPLKTNFFPGDAGGAYAQLSITSAGVVTVLPSVNTGVAVVVTSPPIWID